LKLYRRAITANPRHSLALFNMGALYIHTGDSSRGLSFIERAIRLNPDNASFHENLARLCLAFPGLDASIRLLEDFVQRFPKAVGCLSSLAEIYFRSHQFDKAADTADQALTLESPKLALLLTSAKANFSRGNFDAAEAAYRAALLQDPLNLDGMMNLAAIAEIRREDSVARTWYLRLLDAYPGQPLALKRLAATQIRTGFDEEAASVLERACSIDSIDPQSLILVGSLFEKAGKADRAAALYRSAAAKKPEWAQTVNRRVEQLHSSPNDGGIS
jgi:tetratricopeptide (TPR) repeat protein